MMNRMFTLATRATVAMLLLPACAKAAIPMSVYQSMVVPIPRKFANQGGYYSLHAGLVAPDSIKMDTSVDEKNLRFNNDPTMQLKGSYVVGGCIGYRYKRLRIEGEFTYHRNNIRKFRHLPDGFNNIGYQIVANPKTDYRGPDSIGRLTAIFGMFNIYWDFHFSSGINPFIGAGIGGAYTEYLGAFHNGTMLMGKPVRVNINEKGINFAYQLIAGVGYIFTDRIEADIAVKYFESKLGDFELTGAQYPETNPSMPATTDEVRFEPKSYSGTLVTLEIRFS